MPLEYWMVYTSASSTHWCSVILQLSLVLHVPILVLRLPKLLDVSSGMLQLTEEKVITDANHNIQYSEHIISFCHALLIGDTCRPAVSWF